MNKHLKTISIVCALFAILFLLLFGLGSALAPLVFSFGLAYLILPLIKKMESKGVSRSLAVSLLLLLIFITATLVLAIAVPKLISDSKELSRNLPHIAASALTKIETLSSNYGFEIDFSKENIIHFIEQNRESLQSKVSTGGTKLIKSFFSGVTNWILALLNLFLIPLFFFYIINDFEKITSQIKSFIPTSMLPRLSRYSNLSNTVLSGYIRGQLMVALLLGSLYAFGLTVIDLKFGFLIGIISGLISIIPYAGLSIGLSLALLVGFANFTGPGSIVGILVVFIIVQALEGTIITPKLVGDKVGLSALTTMLALIIGGNLMGVSGMVLAIPIAAIAKSVLSDLKKEYQDLEFYKS